jgi:hypothetical protein
VQAGQTTPLSSEKIKRGNNLAAARYEGYGSPEPQGRVADSSAELRQLKAWWSDRSRLRIAEIFWREGRCQVAYLTIFCTSDDLAEK